MTTYVVLENRLIKRIKRLPGGKYLLHLAARLKIMVGAGYELS